MANKVYFQAQDLPRKGVQALTVATSVCVGPTARETVTGGDGVTKQEHALLMLGAGTPLRYDGTFSIARRSL